jgi:hypothetical protein
MISENPEPPKPSEMMRRELMNVTKRWVAEADLDYAELFGTLEIIKMTYWQDWTEKKRDRGDFDKTL